jgi:uncharacterized Zn finger protein
MKCPNCSSQMFITDETVNHKSHVIFFRCSLCVSEHVSAEPVKELMSRSASPETGSIFSQTATRVQFAI